MNKKLFIAIIAIIFLVSCRQQTRIITNPADYSHYMQLENQQSLKSFQSILTEISFWNQRLKDGVADDILARVKLAGLYSARFKVSGNIDDIHTSDSLYLLANPLMRISSSSVFRSLATNCITQHRFRQAKLYIDTALSMGDNKYYSLLMQCDVAMELGNLFQAKKALEKLNDKFSFDYRIREAKLLDHEGKPEEAIKKMERGMQEVIESNNDVLFGWVKTNLGDMYGHANRYKDAYRSYLDALERDPENIYALKGIAWLAFSHDKNTAEAKRILQYLSVVHPVPDYELMLAKIADYENEPATKNQLMNKFITEVKHTRYGGMYNKYLFYLVADELKNLPEALAIAETEVENRPTGQSYDLLAWAKFKSGKKEEALKIAKEFVENKNFEPEALYHLGVIYTDAGEVKKGRKYLMDAKQSSFELGPAMSEQVTMAMEKTK